MERLIKSAAVTGATGMIGATLIRSLLNEGIRVMAVVREDTDRLGQLPQSELLSIVKADLDHLESVEASEQYDAFFHLGWASTFGDGRNNTGCQLDNVRYTLDAAELASTLGCKVFVGAGSQAEYGNVQGALSAETPAFPVTGYGIAKLCAGQMSRLRCSQLGMHHIWCRILSVYGPFDNPNTMISSGIRALLKGERPSYTKGEQMWDYLYSEDAAKALYLAAEKGKNNAVYCVGSGKVRPLKDYIIAVRDAAAPGADIGIGEREYPEGQVMYLQADIGSLQADTGFEPEIGFEEGIKKTVEWMRSVCRQQ